MCISVVKPLVVMEDMLQNRHFSITITSQKEVSLILTNAVKYVLVAKKAKIRVFRSPLWSKTKNDFSQYVFYNK